MSGRARRMVSRVSSPKVEICRSTTRYWSDSASSNSVMLPMIGSSWPWTTWTACSKTLVSPARRIGSSATNPIRIGLVFRFPELRFPVSRLAVSRFPGLRIEDIFFPKAKKMQESRTCCGDGKRLSPFSCRRCSFFNHPDRKACANLKLGKHNPLLILIFAFAIRIADLAGLIGAEKQNLAQPFVGVNLGRQWSCI